MMKTIKQKSTSKFKIKMVLQLLKACCSLYEWAQKYKLTLQQPGNGKRDVRYQTNSTAKLKQIGIMAIVCLVFAGCGHKEGRKKGGEY